MMASPTALSATCPSSSCHPYPPTSPRSHSYPYPYPYPYPDSSHPYPPTSPRSHSYPYPYPYPHPYAAPYASLPYPTPANPGENCPPAASSHSCGHVPSSASKPPPESQHEIAELLGLLLHEFKAASDPSVKISHGSRQDIRSVVEDVLEKRNGPWTEREVREAPVRPTADVSRHPVTAPAAETFTNARRRLLVDFQRPDTSPYCFTGGLTFHEMVEQTVDALPDATAIIHENDRLSYRTLNEYANQLAWHLVEDYGIGVEHSIALFLERGPQQPISILGVLKAGAQYVPLDAAVTADARHAFVVKDCGCRLLLTQPSLRPRATALHGTCVEVSLTSWAFGGRPTANLPTHRCPEAAMYTVYTSGSTGNPKGVVLPHRSLYTHMVAWRQLFRLGPGSKQLQVHNYVFDCSVSDWGVLTTGATLCLARQGGQTDISHLNDLVLRHGITHVHMVPTVLETMLASGVMEGWGTVREVATAGEPMKPATMHELHRQCPKASLMNGYGPTETTIICNAWDCVMTALETPIGPPKIGARIYILDAELRLLDVGEVGEIVIGGVGLARGYQNQPRMTAEKFIADPYADCAGGRMYRSGDIGKWLDSGDVLCLGRLDNQVKLRGFRIELGDVEAGVAAVAGVEQCAVVVQEVKGERCLVCYHTGTASAAEIARHLQATRPYYMLPSHYVPLRQFPTLISGKIDRKALPPVGAHAAQAPAAAAAPDSNGPARASPAEEAVAEAFREVLGVGDVGLDDDSLVMGATDMQVATLYGRLQGRFARPLLPQDVFAHPTVRRLAAVLGPVQGPPAGARPGNSDAEPGGAPPPGGGEGVSRAQRPVEAVVDAPPEKVAPVSAPAPAPAPTGAASMSGTERTVAGCFQAVLKLETVDVETDWLQAGGNSMSATLMAFQLQTALGKPVGPGTLFDHPSVKALAAALDAQ